jgi:tRNA (guanine-N7-)-methyltransferase
LLEWLRFAIVRPIMARLRKAGRIWRKPEARAAAERVLIEAHDGLFTIDPSAIFERIAPLEIELGAGRGDFIVARAAECPERNFIAVELSGVVSRMLAVRCGGAGLANLRVARMDARTLVGLMLAPRSVSAYHIYFPDPWPKERHHKHRLFTPRLAFGLARTLAGDGTLCVATDVEEYAAEIFPMLEAAGFLRLYDRAPGAESTAFARKFIALGKPVFAATLRPPRPGAGA